MRFKAVKLFLLLTFCDFIACKGFFTVIGSDLIKLNKHYNVSVTAQGYNEQEILQIAIKESLASDEVKSNVFQKTHNVTLINGKSQNIEFDLSGIPEGKYELEVKKLTGEKFMKFKRLNMNTKKQTVLVQTDKSIYKPSDKIQFRVLILNADMKPLERKHKVQVHIMDGANNRVKQYDDVTFTKGVFQNELQLSDSPVLGIWKLYVSVDGNEETQKYFDVDEYTLPKFEVKLDANPDANFKDGKIKATIKAKYTFGKAVKGQGTVTARVMPYHSYDWFYSPQNDQPEIKVSKAIEVDGKKVVEFDIANELGLKKDDGRDVELFVTFKEEMTGREQNASAKVFIHLTPYEINIETSDTEIKPGMPFSATANVKFHDKSVPVSDTHNPVKFDIIYSYFTPRLCEFPPGHFLHHPEYNNSALETTTIPTYECRERHNYTITKKSFLSNGFAKIDIDIPSNTSQLDIYAKYLQDQASRQYITLRYSKNKEYLKVRLLTTKPKVSESIKIEILGTKNVENVTYLISSNRNILESQTISLPETKIFQFELMPTLQMSSNVYILVYAVENDGEIISDAINFNLDRKLENFVKISLSKEQTKPGANLDIEISSKSNSFIGLLGVDQSVLLLKKGNDIENSTVLDEIEAYNDQNAYNDVWREGEDYQFYRDFQYSQTALITNANPEGYEKYLPDYGEDLDRVGIEYDNDMVYNAPPMAEAVGVSQEGGFASRVPIIIRKTFPETWIFDNFNFDSNTSHARISKKVPDTITSWIITGFAVDPIFGLGLTENPSKLTVFQSFFVSTNLPYSIKRGEVVSIPVIVFNYLSDDQKTEVTLFNEDGEFEFAEINHHEGTTQKRKRRSLECQRSKNIIAKSQAGTSVSFMIKPLKVGHITIKVVVASPIAGDGVERQLIVEPEGVTQYKNKAILIDLRNSSEFQTHAYLKVPLKAVPDSTRIEASAIGDILGPSIDNLDKLIKLPWGCGEQNMLNFVPNIVVLDYLTELNKLTPEIEEKAKRYMESGYQRELTYKHDDGSYSAFGKSDPIGSTWLTAFVARSFNKASKYINVDENIIKHALDFLSSAQSNGRFLELGHVSHKDMQGGASNGIGLTAYTLITFLENEKLLKNYQTTIDKALKYIIDNIDSLDDNYSLAITSYALQLAKHAMKDSLLAKLDARSINNEGLKHWEKKETKEEDIDEWSYQPNSVNVEMSAYALHSFIEAGLENECFVIMNWLVRQRNENGGFHSTQDTVVGLQALSKLAAKVYTPNNNIDINIRQKNGDSVNITLNEKNGLILQKHELPVNARDFEITATGNGLSILQLSYKYNMNITDNVPRFILKPEVQPNSNKEFLHLKVCTSFVPDDLTKESNMAVMEVTFPSGFTFDTDTTPVLKATETVKKVETKDEETVVVVYFDNLSDKMICPEFKAYRVHSVAKQKPAPVIIYDYYDNSRRATNFYNPPEISLCDICNGADECKDDCELKEVHVTV
ncbi:CLUMA_CG015756, isoform A [Clunio marinus]|uniref:TEP1-F n=1 Tax=Clunio marinus TaxID=568069 RepID=A0A1J1IR22_9DIPT|nr:CLUMA_CG015756, isoform A [Clunio marinus]